MMNERANAKQNKPWWLTSVKYLIVKPTSELDEAKKDFNTTMRLVAKRIERKGKKCGIDK